jgi:hypothetical protein
VGDLSLHCTSHLPSSMMIFFNLNHDGQHSLRHWWPPPLTGPDLTFFPPFRLRLSKFLVHIFANVANTFLVVQITACILSMSSISSLWKHNLIRLESGAAPKQTSPLPDTDFYWCLLYQIKLLPGMTNQWVIHKGFLQLLQQVRSLQIRIRQSKIKSGSKARITSTLSPLFVTFFRFLFRHSISY